MTNENQENKWALLLFDAKEAGERGCQPFEAVGSDDGSPGVYCRYCRREWTMIDGSVAFDVYDPEIQFCNFCEPCHDTHCKSCTIAEVQWNGMLIVFRKYGPPYETICRSEDDEEGLNGW
jgi:hypothetical protein